ncbi:MAG: TetR/AcrR family transcriptional regulator [Chloroflexota bacterium]
MAKKIDRRIRRTRKLLQDALIQLLRQKPLAKIQIKEIVDVADVSRPTFYQHFETKEKLLFSLVDDLFEKVGTAVFDDVKQGGVADMQTLLSATYKQWMLHSEELQWVFQIENKDFFVDALKLHLLAMKRELDKFQPLLEPAEQYEEYIISFIAGGLYMLVRSWLQNGMRESAETMAEITFLLITNGFTPAKGRAF